MGISDYKQTRLRLCLVDRQIGKKKTNTEISTKNKIILSHSARHAGGTIRMSPAV